MAYAIMNGSHGMRTELKLPAGLVCSTKNEWSRWLITYDGTPEMPKAGDEPKEPWWKLQKQRIREQVGTGRCWAPASEGRHRRPWHMDRARKPASEACRTPCR